MSIQQQDGMTASQKEGMQRIIDRRWSSLETIVQSMKEAESNAIKFLFNMNGAGILAILTFLGAFHNISIYSFIWVLVALLFLVSGLLLAAYLSLRIMKLCGRNGQYMQEQLMLHQQMLSDLILWDEKKIKENSDKALRIAQAESKKDLILIMLVYCLFSISVGFLTNGLIYMRFSDSRAGFLWVIGIGVSLALASAACFAVYRLLRGRHSS